MSGTFKLILWTLVLVPVFAAFAPDDANPARTPVAEPPQEDAKSAPWPTAELSVEVFRKRADYSRPIYTHDNAIVCPVEALLENKEGRRLVDLFKEAGGSVPKLKRAMLDLGSGCTERLAGNRIYIDPDDVDNDLQRIRFDRKVVDGEWVLMSYDVRN
ncbi:MAG: hypothetical protein Q8S92_22705 [Hydrogenophaga sp.]|uniref:hypothetical protein n=1 Tax=Hydrogenophaga sp. TaxID=1904254 RepID=UPI002733782B|nr:hypothetical protein [Hydrogenophaga sp.]MDP3351806.1 hypothetical protein [Hydrogenophaga sp.]